MMIIMWILGALPAAVCAVLLQFMPETVPLHFDINGDPDRFGSKYELLVISLLFLLLPLMFTLLKAVFGRKAKNAHEEKDRVYAGSNLKVMYVIGISTSLIFDILFGLIMYLCFIGSQTNGSTNSGLIVSFSCMLPGILLIIFGNVIQKTRKNRLLGMRTKWSMYNDNTWMKSNRFSGVVMMITGLLIVISSVLTRGAVCAVILLVLITAAIIITTIYSYKIYKNELRNGGG